MKVTVYNQEGKEVGSIELPADVFEVPFAADLVHQAIVAQRSNARHVIANTKDRSEVRGGGKKPWRQKHTGRARHGSIRSPLWKGGGVTFGPTAEKNYKKKINKKMKRKALCMALSSKARDNEMVVLDALEVTEPKTRIVSGIISSFSKAFSSHDSSQDVGDKKEKGVRGTFLLVIPRKDEIIGRSARNIPLVKVLHANSLNVVDVLSYKYLFLPKESIAVIKDTYGG